MAGAPPSTLRLPTTLFNKTLTNNLTKIWFADLPAGAKNHTEVVNSRWFGLNRTPEQRQAFDELLRSTFGEVLSAVSPAKLALPPFKSADDDRRNAALLCRPLRRLDMLRKDTATDDARAEAGLGLVLLLDQVPRNIFRKDEDKGVVFAHYDRIALAFAHCIVSETPTGVLDASTDFPVTVEEEKAQLADVSGIHQLPWLREFFPYRSWFYLPFMHSEDLKDHDVYSACLDEFIENVCDENDEESMAFPIESRGFEKVHRDIVEEFGRYPHRNRCLGREDTDAERKFLDGGGQTFTR